MRYAKDRDGSTAGKSSATMVSCVCATVPSELMASFCSKFILLDLTAKGAETAMLRPSHGLDIVNESLRQRVAELEAKNKELEAFAHTVAHDLKGPVGRLTGYTDLVRIEYTSLSDDEMQR